MTDKSYINHLKSSNADPISVLQSLLKENNAINHILINSLVEIAITINNPLEHNKLIELSNNFINHIEQNFPDINKKINEIVTPSFLNKPNKDSKHTSKIWEYLKIKNILKIFEDTFNLININNKHKRICIMTYLKDNEPTFINNDFMKKFCYEIVYIGKILEVCSIKMAKMIDQLDTVVNEYNDIVKDTISKKNKKVKDDEDDKDDKDDKDDDDEEKIKIYNHYTELVGINNEIVLIEDINTLVSAIKQYQEAINYALISIENHNGEFNSSNYSLLS